MMGSNVVDSIVLSRFFNLKNIITNQDLRKLTSSHAKPWGRFKGCTVRKQLGSLYKLGPVNAVSYEINGGSAKSLVAEHNDTLATLDILERGVQWVQWRSLCTQVQGCTPPLELEQTHVNGTSSPTIPKPLSSTEFMNPPSHGSIVRVAYQGVPGAYSEEATAKAYPNCEAVPCEQFDVAFQAVELWLVDRAVLPIENSLSGSIHRNYDLLLCHRLHIVGEVQLPVNHCLLALPGIKKEEMKRVLSHPKALAQCEGTLSKLGVIREAVDDTAGAAQHIAHNCLCDTGAVASARAAEIYGLNILAEGIQDDVGNVTRFLMLAREPIIPRTDRPFKTSIVFTLEEGPGVLFKALSAFSVRDISVTKIESRPQRKRPLRVVDHCNHGVAKYFDYLFYVDFEASMADPNAQNALGQLQEFATFLRVLGSYPMDVALRNAAASTK